MNDKHRFVPLSKLHTAARDRYPSLSAVPFADGWQEPAGGAAPIGLADILDLREGAITYLPIVKQNRQGPERQRYLTGVAVPDLLFPDAMCLSMMTSSYQPPGQSLLVEATDFRRNEAVPN